jgi:chromosome segregation ATPase
MKIIRLTSENVKRLNAVEITPAGNLVVIGGQNGQGKSSVLDSIELALGGGKGPAVPVRRGESKARVVVDLGDLVVRRTWTASGGSQLVVTDREGAKQASPQTLLDRMTGKLSFDPLEFSRQKPELQAETLRKLVGLDLSRLDEERRALYDERTVANRELKAAEIRMQAQTHYADAPAEERSAADVLAAQNAAAAHNRRNDELRHRFRSAAMNERELQRMAVAASDRQTQAALEVQQALAELEAAKEATKAALAALAEGKRAKEQAEAAEAAAKDQDMAQFAKQIAELDALNVKVRSNKFRAAAVARVRELSSRVDGLTADIDAIDGKKCKAVAAVQYPIAGLGIDAASGAVTLNGLPLEQASSAEQLRVSVAIGLALNPKLKVVLIRDGSCYSMRSACGWWRRWRRRPGRKSGWSALAWIAAPAW